MTAPTGSGKLVAMRKKSDTCRVVIVAMPGVPLFELAGAAEIFGVDRRDLTPDWYEFELVGTSPETTIGFGMQVPNGRGLDALSDADTIIVPACANIHDGAPTALLEALVQEHARGARIVSLCSGAFVLAEAGLLDGRRATTHWMHAEALARLYPSVTVDPGVLYVHDDVWTSAGSAAAIDLSLELVRRDFGAAIANEVARRVVIPPHRDGGQSQFIRYRPHTASSRDDDVEHWAREHLADVTVTAMARYAGVSVRSLNRQFRSRTNLSPQEWLRREKLQATQELLESSDLTVEAIALRVGLGTAANLRTHFAAEYGVPPGAYRRTFSSHQATDAVPVDAPQAS